MNKITMLKLFYVIGLFENGFVINSWQQLLLETHEDNKKFDKCYYFSSINTYKTKHFHTQKILSNEEIYILIKKTTDMIYR